MPRNYNAETPIFKVTSIQNGGIQMFAKPCISNHHHFVPGQPIETKFSAFNSTNEALKDDIHHIYRLFVSQYLFKLLNVNVCIFLDVLFQRHLGASISNLEIVRDFITRTREL